MENQIFLSVVITQYNEKKNLTEKKVMEKLDNYLQQQNYSWEVIVNDDGSTDGSYEFMKEFAAQHNQFKVIKGNHGGKAAGLLNGIKEAQGKIICTTDMDMSTPISEIEKLLPYFEQGFEAVIGSRGHKRENSSPFRKLASFLFGVFRKALLLRKIDDTQCGFKAYKSTVAKRLFPKLDAVNMKVEGWTVTAFDVELLFMIQKSNCQIKEVSVQWRDEDVSNTKDRDGKFVKESIDMAKQIFQVRWNWIKGKYKNLKCEE
jgi:dolichyl-phosphate beta-glucosyltransferase